VTAIPYHANPGSGNVTVYRHTHIALFTPICKVDEGFNPHIQSTPCPIDEVNVGVKGHDSIPEHLQNVYEVGCEGFDSSQQEKCRAFLIEKQDSFARPGEVGRTNLCTHAIRLKDDVPIREAPRRVPLYKRDALDGEISQLEKQGLIENSESPWSSQIVMVQKKDGTWRMCVDYRKLNEKTIKDAYPITRIDDNLDALSGADWFTSLDLEMAYHQVPMREGDKEKTAFATPRNGLYQFTTIVFGLCNAQSTFQRIMEKALTGLHRHVAVLYLDDIIAFGRTFDESLENTAEVIDRLQTAGLKLKPGKCCFLRREARFLGYIVSKEGVRKDPSKIEAVMEMPRPTNVTEVRSYLGLTSYYRKFVKDYSRIAKPLYDLTKKDKHWVWSVECEQAFLELKERLVCSPIPAYPPSYWTQMQVLMRLAQ
jgi:hypothetical protein